MAIIFNEERLTDVKVPCVAQSFVNHNARLFKIFVIGQKHFVIQRPSIRNFYDRSKLITSEISFAFVDGKLQSVAFY